MPRITEQPTTSPTTPIVHGPVASDPCSNWTTRPSRRAVQTRSAARSAHHELALRGIPMVCSGCQAERDWLLINHGRRAWIRCRCRTEWLESEIARKDYDTMLADPTWTYYPTLDQGADRTRVPGTFAGLYLDY
ncbi:hypothetical protein AB0D10_46055 [Kitasatospora sp. NPDC048545]|uniref:hypothetical protein n=1 Tax=Kitasatospora sp. NPDC048545 TaxID=3157208 RepID=UPI003400E2E6